MSIVAVRQIGLGYGLGAAHAFVHVLARHLDMDTARVGAFAAVDVEERLDLREDEIERPRLVTASRLDGVAVHGIARPHYRLALALHGADERRQVFGDLVGAKAANEREPPRLVVRIE